MDKIEKLSIDIFVAKTRNYDIFVAKIYDYVLINSFWGYPRFIDSPTSYATLHPGKKPLKVSAPIVKNYGAPKSGSSAQLLRNFKNIIQEASLTTSLS